MDNKPCPSCTSVGRDKTGNHLFLMGDGITWYCTRCKYRESQFGEQLETKEESNHVTHAPLEEISKLNSDSIRGIPNSFIDRYGIKVEYDEYSGEHSTYYAPIYSGDKLVSYKQRLLPKAFDVTHPTKGLEVELFGQHLFNKQNGSLLITEGELDAVACAYMLRKWKIPCVSLTFGANLKCIRDNVKFINKFKTVYFYPDQDEAGLALVQEIAVLFPEIKVVYTKEKDACDMMASKKEDELVASVFQAERYKPSSIVTVKEILEEAVRPVEKGLEYPFEQLNKFTYGARLGEVIGIASGPGAGKTTFMNQISRHLMYHHGEPVGVFSLEESPTFTLKKYIGSILNLPIHLPDTKYDLDQANEIGRELEERLFLYNHNGQKDWNDIVASIRFFRSQGVRYVIIDPLSALTVHLSASQANDFISSIMIELSGLANELEMTFFHINHLNNASTGKDHGAGGRVYGGQFTGSRAQWRFSDAMWGLIRNQLAEEDMERNRVEVSIIKNRFSGLTGSFFLSYDFEKGVLTETPTTYSGGSF